MKLRVGASRSTMHVNDGGVLRSCNDECSGSPFLDGKDVSH